MIRALVALVVGASIVALSGLVPVPKIFGYGYGALSETEVSYDAFDCFDQLKSEGGADQVYWDVQYYGIPLAWSRTDTYKECEVTTRNYSFGAFALSTVIISGAIFGALGPAFNNRRRI